MAINTQAFQDIQSFCSERKVTLVAVSKTKPAADILALYDLGQRDFGENYVQELVEKQPQLPADIRWHFIGHLQSNKVKYIVPFVHLIHGVDSFKLLKEINKQAAKNNRIIDALLQVHIAKEETKFGLDAAELADLLHHPELPSLQNICIKGLMGMASFSDDHDLVRSEFKSLKTLFDKQKTLATSIPIAIGSQLSNLSMGMSGDYQLAVSEGSNMVRIGSLLFGARH